MADEEYWRSRWQESGAVPNSFARRAYARIKNRRMKTLLDLGCGDGRDSAYFARRGLDVTAVDYSKSGIAMLRRRNPEMESYLQDLRKLKMKARRFDVIYAHLSLHYFSDAGTRSIFAKIHRALRPGGFFFVKVKSTSDSMYGKGKKVGRDTFRSGHTRHFFSKEYMGECLSQFLILSLRKTSSVYTNYRSSFIEAVARK